MINITIHPDYKKAPFIDFIENIPSKFSSTGNTIYKGRNEVKTFEVGGMVLNVKSYKVPIFINKIAYGFFRPGKAKRAFEYAKKLVGMGVETPFPIAYIEEKTAGLLKRSYFVSTQCPYPNNFHLFKETDEGLGENEELFVAFGRYSAWLHGMGVYHKDYSPGNILFDKIDGKYQFSLIDINRMEFHEVNMKQGCENFARLRGSKEMFHLIASVYAKERNFDVEECERILLAAKQKDIDERKRRKAFKAKYLKKQ